MLHDNWKRNCFTPAQTHDNIAVYVNNKSHVAKDFMYLRLTVVSLLFFVSKMSVSMSGENLTLDTVGTGTVANLKKYVKKRGLPVSATKKVLAARAYVAWELRLPMIPMPAEVAKEYRDHVERLLKTPEGDKLHHDNLKHGWLDEDQDMPLWPPSVMQDCCVPR